MGKINTIKKRKDENKYTQEPDHDLPGYR
jgi:hypothetical protein